MKSSRIGYVLICEVTKEFDPTDRRFEKRRSRESDASRLSAGDVAPERLRAENGFFDALDRSKARIVAVRLPPSFK